MSLFLDTGVLLAILHRDDARHEAVASVFREIAKGDHGRPYLSDFVIDELFTLIRTRTGSKELEERASDFLPLPDPELPGLTVLEVRQRHLARTWRFFDRYRDQGLSFTDASHLVLMDEHEIPTIASFDTDFDGLVDRIPAR